MRYIDPNQPGSKVQFKSQYENFIGGEWVAPLKSEYFDNVSPGWKSFHTHSTL